MSGSNSGSGVSSGASGDDDSGSNWESASGKMKGSVSNSSGYVINSEYNVVGSDDGDLSSGAVSVSVYVGSGWSSGDWSAWEDGDLDSIVMSYAVGYGDMGGSDSVAGDLAGSEGDDVASIEA